MHGKQIKLFLTSESVICLLPPNTEALNAVNAVNLGHCTELYFLNSVCKKQMSFQHRCIIMVSFLHFKLREA